MEKIHIETNGRFSVLGLFSASLLCWTSAMAAVPTLKSKPERIEAIALSVKVPMGLRPEAIPMPKALYYHFKSGDGQREETHYLVKEIWMSQAHGGLWRDAKGNEFRVARVNGALPDGNADAHAKREDMDQILKSAALSEPDDAALARWVSDYTGDSVSVDDLSQIEGVRNVSSARYVRLKSDNSLGALFLFEPKGEGLPGGWYYVSAKVGGKPAKEVELRKYLRTVVAGTSQVKAAGTNPGENVPENDVRRAAAKGSISGMPRWWSSESKDYIFLTDMSRSQGGRFVKDATKLMGAMRKAYARYVPGWKEVGTSVVRVFATKEGYDAYNRSANGMAADRSIGLWSPSHEELLIMDLGNSARVETQRIMRHEAFHQYLFYATGGGHHMTWFNEGHATFFECVQYNPKKDEVRIGDEGRWADRVAGNVDYIASLIPGILRLSYEEFYDGDLKAVNDRYAAAWAVTYFLEKGVPIFDEFSAYRKVLPTYMSSVREGESPTEASAAAWATVGKRDVSADFLRFWGKRVAAKAYEPK